MIILTQAEGLPDRVIQGVKFEDGKAYLPDHLYKKANSICNYFSVEMTITEPEVSESSKEPNIDGDDLSGIDLSDETGLGGSDDDDEDEDEDEDEDGI